VLVDDVTTTGATLRSAARALRTAGAPWVAGLTAARTPRRAAVPDVSVGRLPLGVDKSLKLAPESTEYRW
jgi:adenine/guanine phosphoribosyltransferase-like PRPP-binding protein